MTTTYTVEIEFDSKTLWYEEDDTNPLLAKDNALDLVPAAADIHRVGVWTGGVYDRPDGGHEDGLLDP